MRAVQLALLADGPSDVVLQEPLTWAVRQRAPDVPLLPWRFRARTRPGKVSIEEAIDDFMRSDRPDLLFVHRDAEAQPWATRRAEVPTHAQVVPVIPVRMTEAWLLIDEHALRRAAGNPHGTAPLELPRLRTLESLADPKAALRECLERASGLKGRRLSQFDRVAARRRVAEEIEDYAALRGLAAYGEVERALDGVWDRVIGGRSGA